jgi:hypothetical protein
MVRPNGQRSYDAKSGRVVTVVELLTGKSRIDKKQSWSELRLFEPNTGKPAFADFARVHHIPLIVLDLCALDPEGIARIIVDGPCPSFVIDPWKRRYEALQKIYERGISKFDLFKSKNIVSEIAVAALPVACPTVQFIPTVVGKTVQYQLERIARLNQPRSGALLTEFMHYQSRAAFEHDVDNFERFESGE